MAIHIRQFPEPLSDRSFTEPVVIAQCHASTVLRHELQRYCDGNLDGRSFLIAAHRGAGKTTLVNSVILDMIKKSEQGKVALRPLPVLLHGPALFNAFSSDARPAHPAAPAANASTSPTAASMAAEAVERQTLIALEQIVLGLHRAVVREFVRSYRRKCRETRKGPAGEHGELAGQFEMELQEFPPASRLREFWEHADALDSGVLFPRNIQAARASQFQNVDKPGECQGMLELAALNGICGAHQRISGDLSGTSEQKQGLQQSNERVRGWELKTAELLKPVTAVLAGSAVAGGSAAGQWPLPVALGLGMATALLSSLAFKNTNSTTRKRERQLDFKFIPRLDVRTLDRVMPVLLQRLRDAGLAPVLLVDELDKVNGLSQRMPLMVGYLKKLMAEGVFSCFLTDRGYSEYLRLEAQDKAYAAPYSFFSHSLQVALDASDIDAYLDQVLQVSIPAERDHPSAVPEGRIDAESQKTPQKNNAESADREILKWILRHRCEMHALELVRELAALRDADSDQIGFSTGTVRTDNTCAIDATVQLAIEFQLGQPEVANWLQQQPGIRGALFDALYYISRQWKSSSHKLDLRDSALPEFRNALYGRMNLDDVYAVEGVTAHAPNPALRTGLAQEHIERLFELVRNMAAMLSGNQSIEDIARNWPTSTGWRSVKPLGPQPKRQVLELFLVGSASFLEQPNETVHSYRFRYLPSGESRFFEPLQPPRPGMPDPEMDLPSETAPAQGIGTGAATTARSPQNIHRQAKRNIEYIERLEQSLCKLLWLKKNEGDFEPGTAFEWLSDRTHILPQTPAWQQALRACAELANAGHGLGSPVELERQLQLANNFASMLRRNIAHTGPVLLVAAFLEGVGRSKKVLGGIMAQLELLSAGLSFSNLGAETLALSTGKLLDEMVVEFTKKLADDVAKKAKASFTSGTHFLLDDGNLTDDALAKLEAAMELGSQWSKDADWPAAIKAAWHQLLDRLKQEQLGVEFSPAGLQEFLCTASRQGAWLHMIEIDPRQANLSHWTIILVAAIATQGREKVELPFGIAAHALLHLGLGNLPDYAMESFCRDLQRKGGMKEGEDQQLLRSLRRSWQRPAQPSVQGSMVMLNFSRRLSTTYTWTDIPKKSFCLVVGDGLALEDERNEIAFKIFIEILKAMPKPLRIYKEGAFDPRSRMNEVIEQLIEESRTTPGFQVSVEEIDPDQMARWRKPNGADDLFSAGSA